MKYWLKLSLSGLAVATLALANIALPSFASKDFAYAEEVAPTIVQGAKNSSMWAGADAAGLLYWSEDSGTTWVSSGFGLTKSGVSSVVWTGTSFLATSYFEGARSSDGKNWTRFMLPLGSAFDPGNVISDAEFFSAGSMTVDEIQTFLEQRNPTCRDGYVCIKDFTETTFDREETVLCQAYDGAENESAAQILNKVSSACGVSVEALLVLIQKEQSLITLTAPSATRFERATGYACPDTAPCDEKYFGFYNQVYNAAKQFKRYSNPPGTSRFFTWFPVGSTSQVRYHPNTSCGTKPVIFRNQASAGLHYYTPYTPNDIAVTNLASTGDSCSAYGNRNFWRVYNYWFNPTKSFRTSATTKDGLTMVVDGDGTIAISTGLSSWQRLGTVPNATMANQVSEFGQTAAGNFAALMADGTAYESGDGQSWSQLTVQKSEVVQDVVVKHTVQSGDTVWAISKSNSVAVSAVVTENSLAREGALIRVGQVLTITKRGVVNTVTSPVALDPSIVISAGAAAEASDETPAEGSEETPAEDSTADESSSSDASDSSSEPLPALEPIVTETASSDVFYTVAKGDTLLRVAFRNKTTVSKIAAANSISNVNRIYEGQRLKVGTANQNTTYHRAQSGDTPERIAERRSVDLSTLLSLNSSLSSGQVITVGELVRLS